jgi:LmbE family N-acetylglucosaminyl deacetylase
VIAGRHPLGVAPAVTTWQGRGSSLYCWCIVRSLLRRWLEIMRQLRPGTSHLQPEEDGLSRPDEAITTTVDVSAYVERRWAAMAMHRSQRSPFDGMPAGLVEALLRCDRLVRAEPPWSGGPVERQLFVPRR